MPDASTASTVSAASKVFASPLTVNGTETVASATGLPMVICGASDGVGAGDVAGFETGDGLRVGPDAGPDAQAVTANTTATTASVCIERITMMDHPSPVGFVLADTRRRCRRFCPRAPLTKECRRTLRRSHTFQDCSLTALNGRRGPSTDGVGSPYESRNQHDQADKRSEHCNGHH